MDLARLRTELAAALAPVRPVLNVYAYIPDSVSPPCAFFVPGRLAMDRAMGRGMDEWSMTMRLLVSRADDEASQKRLDAYLSGSGPGSVKAALEAARGAPGESALNGAADDVHAGAWDRYGLHEHFGVMFLGAELDIRIIGSGS
jgi:hypothetical protein